MKQFKYMVMITILAYNFVAAQDNHVTITGPTCLQVGDTVIYNVSKPIPGYHWGCPSGLMLLLTSADNTSVTYIVQSILEVSGSVWYGPLAYSSKGAISLQVYAKTQKPYFLLTTAGQTRKISTQIPAGATSINLEISPPIPQTDPLVYELSSSNPTWTFGNENKNIMATAKSFLSQRIQLNIGTGKTDIIIKTNGACDTRTDMIQLVQP